jgi:hypothetical protein
MRLKRLRLVRVPVERAARRPLTYSARPTPAARHAPGCPLSGVELWTSKGLAINRSGCNPSSRAGADGVESPLGTRAFRSHLLLVDDPSSIAHLKVGGMLDPQDDQAESDLSPAR